MYILSIEQNIKGIGNTLWKFNKDELKEAMEVFIDQVKGFLSINTVDPARGFITIGSRIHVKLVKDENIIAEFKNQLIMHSKENTARVKKIFDKLPPEVAHEVIEFSNNIHPQYKDRLMDMYLLLIEHVYAIDREQTSGVLWEFSSNEPPSEGSLIIMDFAGMYMLGEMIDGIYYNYHSHMAVRPPQRWRYLHA